MTIRARNPSIVILVAGWALLAVGCGGTDGGGSGVRRDAGRPDSAPSRVSLVGRACTDQASCKALPEGYCSRARMCTRRCIANSDCGCAPGTTFKDLVAGRCAAACVGDAKSGYVCIRTCKRNADCDRGVCKVVKMKAGELSLCL